MGNRGRSSGKRLTSSGAVRSVRCQVAKLVIEGTGGTGYVKLFNATSATGTPLFHLVVPDDPSFRLALTLDLDFKTACYADLSNANIVAIFY